MWFHKGHLDLYKTHCFTTFEGSYESVLFDRLMHIIQHGLRIGKCYALHKCLEKLGYQRNNSLKITNQIKFYR